VTSGQGSAFVQPATSEEEANASDEVEVDIPTEIVVGGSDADGELSPVDSDEFGGRPPALSLSDANASGNAFGVDAQRAAQLRADPSAQAGTKIANLVTFRMLSLAGVDVNALVDYIFSPETELARSFEFPKHIKALDGKEAAIVGYMIPLEYKPRTEEIKIFMLVRDLMSCCFGNSPRPDEWVYVEMEGDTSAKFYPYMPITAHGILHVGRLEDEFGFSAGVYSLKARSVELFKVD